MKPIRKEKLSELIYDNIVELIQEDEYQIGDRLPSENELANFYKVSRAPIREAISKLVSVGYVESNQGKGSYIKKVNITDEIMQFTYGEFSKKELFDLLEMRTIIEVQSASLAAERHNDNDILEIKKSLDNFKKITTNQKIIGMKADYDFHEAIVKSTKNDYMIQTYTNLQAVHQNALEFSLKLNVDKPRKREQVYDEHVAVYKAIKNKDSSNASKSMETHLFNMRRKLGDDRI